MMNTTTAHPLPASSPRIRHATSDDALALATLLQGIGWFSTFAQGAPETHVPALRPLLTPSTHGIHLLAEDTQGQLLGYCALHWLPVAFLKGYEAYLSELFVAESARSSGTGTSLLHAAVAAARTQGCERIWLINNKERQSYQRGFYEKHGWTEHPAMARFVLPLSD